MNREREDRERTEWENSLREKRKRERENTVWENRENREREWWHNKREDRQWESGQSVIEREDRENIERDRE